MIEGTETSFEILPRYELSIVSDDKYLLTSEDCNISFTTITNHPQFTGISIKNFYDLMNYSKVYPQIINDGYILKISFDISKGSTLYHLNTEFSKCERCDNELSIEWNIPIRLLHPSDSIQEP